MNHRTSYILIHSTKIHSTEPNHMSFKNNSNIFLLYALFLQMLILSSCDPYSEAPYFDRFIGFDGINVSTGTTSTPKDGIIITGYTNSISGNNDIYIFQLTRDLKLDWSKTFGGKYFDSGHAVLLSHDDNIVVAGTVAITPFNNDIVIIKLNSQGQILWTKHLSTPTLTEQCTQIIQLHNENILIAGFQSPPGVKDIFDPFLIKLTPSGEVLWSRSYGISTQAKFNSIVTTNDDGFMAVGMMTSNPLQAAQSALIIKFNQTGDVEWQNFLAPKTKNDLLAIRETPDHYFSLIGTTAEVISGTPGLSDIWILKISSNGHVMWENMFGQSFRDEGTVITVTPQGDYLFAGITYTSSNSYSALVGKTDPAGNLMWMQPYVLKDIDERPVGIQNYDFGFLIVANSKNKKTHGNFIHITRLDSEGQPDFIHPD